MKNQQKSPQGRPGERGSRDKQYVRNQFKIGDSMPYFMNRPDNQSHSSMLDTQSKVEQANAYLAQPALQQPAYIASPTGTFKQDIRIRNPRALDIYGNRQKVLKNSYKLPRRQVLTDVVI